MIRTNIDAGTEVVLVNAAASIALPSAAGDGAAINLERGEKPANTVGAWLASSYGGKAAHAAIFVYTSVATALTAPLALFGYRADLDHWFNLGALNNNQAITTQDPRVGWSDVVEYAGIYDRLAVGPATGAVAVTPGAGTVTVRACAVRVNDQLGNAG